MKKLITAILAITLTTLSMPAQANLKNRTSVPTLAVLDTALDTSIPAIKSRLIGEVCILDWPSCPNGTKFMEGAGAAVIPMNILVNRDFNHGTQMVSAAIANNPNMNILFVRIIGHTSRGMRQSTNVHTVTNALEWVYNNRDKYNISAISVSQGNNIVINKKASTNYCPVTATDIMVDRLISVNIPVFFPSGNSGSIASMQNKIEWPACIPNAIAVGGVEVAGLDTPQASRTSNYDPVLVDTWDAMTSRVFFPGGQSGNAYGTSVANQIAASKYVALKTVKPTLTVNQLISLIKSTSKNISNPLGQNILMFDLQKALSN